nr:sugar-binding domain-containing protein [Marinicella sp. W31]MDC2878595.1 sugar-binding domain-containing protein [Marinicella sp. W31]
MLSDARSRGEVIIRIKSDLAPLMKIQRKLEERFGLQEAVVAPLSDTESDPTRAVAAVAGGFVSELMANNLTVGVGWGRTLHAMLPFVEGKKLDGVRIVSLLGGIAQARRFNPAEFAWQFAELFDAEGFLVPAPALVDSAQTKHALLEHCGLDQVLQMAETCDVALVSCGGISTLTTSFRLGHVSEAERQSLIEAGAVGDILYNFLDKDGHSIDHPVNARAMSPSIERLTRIKRKVLISGGTEKTEMILATLKALRPSTLITDELTASRLLKIPF